MIGALDMGGSSTQLVFHTGTDPNQKVHPDHFWSTNSPLAFPSSPSCLSLPCRSHSWLSFGAEKIQEKVWLSIFENYQRASVSSDAGELKGNLFNPCLFKGYRTLYHYNETAVVDPTSGEEEQTQIAKFIYMEGTGEPLKCRQLIQQTLWPEGCEPGGPCSVDAIQHPPVDGLFFGIV
jgi:hypothetical protein